MTANESPAGQGGASNETAAGAVSGVNGTPTGIGVATLSPEHVAELSASAVPLDVARQQGVCTAWTADQLPEPVRWLGKFADKFPALVYPMREIDGTETCQVKPAVPVNDAKYVGPSKRAGHPPQLPVLRLVDGADSVVLVEGCKQALAVLAHGPADVSVARFTGVHSWMSDGAPSPHLPAIVSGKKVVICGDADAATNIAVFDGLAALGEAAEVAGASEVVFIRVPGAAKQGVDDVLAELADDEARREAVVSWIAGAKKTPADLSRTRLKSMRKARARKDAERAVAAGSTPDRVDVTLRNDWHLDCLSIADETVRGLGGHSLFLRGGVSVELIYGADGKALRVLDSDGLHRQVLSVVRLVGTDSEGDPVVVPGLKRDPLGILKGRVAERLPVVKRISRAPVVRPDGSIVTDSGYDSATGVLVDLAPDVEGLTVPLHPADSDIAAAVTLLRDVLFELDGTDGFDGWVFASEADRSNAIGFLLTCVLRSVFPVVPLAVADGLQRGVGKGALVEVVHRVAYGTAATVMAAPSSSAELEKRITSALLAGQSMIFLDEIMGEDGKSRLAASELTSALTAPVWGGRLLGKSESLALEQDAVWVVAGNNVEIPGDTVRRVYPIRLSSDRPGLDTRDNFRRDLNRWVPEHRRDLLTAVLTLVRAWYDRGQPEAPRDLGMVGFTEWQRVIGGILHLAGIEGFLSNVREMRAHSDSEAVENHEHLVWVADAAATLAGAPRFTAKEIVAAAKSDPNHAAPYDRVMGDLDPRGLGRVWKSIAGRWFGDLRIVEDGKAHGNVIAWRVQVAAPAAPAASPAAPTPEPASTPPVPGPRHAAGAAAGELIRYNDHRGVTRDAMRAMPSVTGLTIAELGGGGAP